MNRVIVRCGSGALYSTIWVPLVSVKAIRAGNARFQRCPVHRRWERAERIDETALTADERREAQAHRDVALP